MPNKKVSSTISQDFLVVKLLMATFVIGVFFNLYLFAVHPPWMEQIHSFFESDRPEYRKSKWQTKDEVFPSSQYRQRVHVRALMVSRLQGLQIHG